MRLQLKDRNAERSTYTPRMLKRELKRAASVIRFAFVKITES